MKPSTAPQSIWQMPVGLGVQLLLSHVIAAAVAIAIAHVRLYLGQRHADGPLTLEIEDDGQGFEVDRDDSGMGLENIRQRVLSLGGELAIASAPGKGTTLRVTIPFEEIEL